MNFILKTVIFMCLVIYSTGEGEFSVETDTNSTGISSTEKPTSQEFETKEVTDSTERLPDVISNASTADGNRPSTVSSIDVPHDIEITGTASPSKGGTEEVPDASSENGNLTTDSDKFNETSDVTATQKNEITSACYLSPCKNGGTCVEDPSTPLLFSCVCPTGFVGIRCGTVDKCVVNDKKQMCRNGTCVYSKDGLLRSCQCFTGMYWDEIRKECRDPDPPCFPNPCMNGGICSSKNDMVYCDCPTGYRENNCSVLYKCGNCENGRCDLDDTQLTMYCKCNKGFYWNEEHQTCKEITSPCDSNPCQNGGVCDAISDSEYNCTCAVEFSGKICEIRNFCSEDNDCGHGTCIFSDEKKSRNCQCTTGFYLEEQSHICKESTNVCEPNPCLNDGICTVASSSSYNCTCSPGYVGEKCEVRDLCEMDGGNAYCGDGYCRNKFEEGVYFCTCKEGEYFQYNHRKCVELDICPLMRCDSAEKCLIGKCVCKENYKWDNITEKCIPDFCSSNPCPVSKMICEEGTGNTDYKCYCQEGFSFNGTHCNEASCIFPNLNPCNQHCSVKDGGYKCSCTENFELKEDNSTCAYTGNFTCSNQTCDNGFCVEKDDMEVCLCPPGFVEADGICKDSCSSGQLTSDICPSGLCEETSKNGFRCTCQGKFALSKDKTTCMVRNICHKNEMGWKTCTEKNAECIVDWLSADGFKCVCGNGEVVTEGGTCRDMCSIERNQRQCSIKGAFCDLDTNKKMICKCPPYFKANERDGKCTQPADFSFMMTLPLDKSTYLAVNRKKRSLDPSVDYRRISNDLTITLREMFISFTEANILSCKMASEHILCKIELKFTADSETDLKRLKIEDICVTSQNSNSCLLPPLLVLVKNKINKNVEIQSTDPCDEDIKDLVCGSETTCISSLSYKSFNCSCKPGYFTRRKNFPFGNTRSFVETCSDIDECAEGNPCPANSNCLNTIGSYVCSCKPGFRNIRDAPAIDSQKCIEICNPNPCVHGECSTKGDHEFDCRCEAGYRGTLCNLQDENFKRAKTNTIIVGVVLGGVLLITFILFAACISRLRKKKILENPGHMVYNSTEMTERRRVGGGAVNNAYQRE